VAVLGIGLVVEPQAERLSAETRTSFLTSRLGRRFMRREAESRGVQWPGERVQALPDLPGLVFAALSAVDRQRLLPGGLGLLMLAEGVVSLRHPVCGVGFLIDITQVSEDDQGLLEVVQGLG